MTPSGKLRITGTHAERWLGTVNQYQAQLVDALQADPHPSAQECQHPACDRITLHTYCDRHRAEAGR